MPLSHGLAIEHAHARQQDARQLRRQAAALHVHERAVDSGRRQPAPLTDRAAREGPGHHRLGDLDAPEITVGFAARRQRRLRSPATSSTTTASTARWSAMLAVQLDGDTNVYISDRSRPPESDDARVLARPQPGGRRRRSPASSTSCRRAKTAGCAWRRSCRASKPPSSSTRRRASHRTCRCRAPSRKIRRITNDVSEHSGEDIALLVRRGDEHHRLLAAGHHDSARRTTASTRTTSASRSVRCSTFHGERRVRRSQDPGR